MSGPTKADLDALRRLAQYLVDSPRLVYRVPWQRDAGPSVFVDTDVAGCYVTRKSTSGGVLYRGAHMVKHWSTTQICITLSLGKAEPKLWLLIWGSISLSLCTPTAVQQSRSVAGTGLAA